MKLSVIVPVHNEVNTIGQIIKRVQDGGLVTEIVVVDDASTDGTSEILAKLNGRKGIKVLSHKKNQGKGAAIRTGLTAISGELVLIQDADLEYDPQDYPRLLKPIEEGRADVVYGSRFLGGPRRPILFWNMVANRLLTLLTNILYNNILTDMETGYKLFRKEVILSIPFHSNRFNFEPEITAKLLKRKVRIVEVAISFYPRDYSEGKKIGLRDAFQALWAIIRYRFAD
ncbi:MAG: glycosyltransferase family 2 protein [Chloroflexi bacterium]|nr:glycosyltransferase family 2 protein [Chloroflexota bacterium]MQC25986.1 glycosyltransferase family 2 protein [Chloroflexota bacterium]